MPGDILGVILAVSLIGLCWALALAVKKTQCFNDVSNEVARKIVHIGVSNFAFIYLYVFENDLFPVLGLVAFAFINLYIETHSGNRRSWGTVEYPLVIAGLILVRFFTNADKAYVACALLGMGYGDGFAAIIGKKFGKIKISPFGAKTLAGSLTVLLIVSFICFFVGETNLVQSLLIGLVACIAEAFTPFGLDNISVPLVIYFMEVLFC